MITKTGGGTRLQRQGKIIDRWRLHISWLHGKEDNNRTRWVDKLYGRVEVDSRGLRSHGREPTKTGDKLPGDITTAQIDFLHEYTDFLVVLSVSYLAENADGGNRERTGELSCLLEALRVKLNDSIHSESDDTFYLGDFRIWLAALEELNLRRYRVAGYGLDAEDASGPSPELVRLCDIPDEKRKRFRLPSEGIRFEKEIAEAVDALLCRLEEN